MDGADSRISLTKRTMLPALRALPYSANQEPASTPSGVPIAIARPHITALPKKAMATPPSCHARGVIYLAARQCGVPVLALAPSEVKRAITGNGAAGKAQMQRGVQTLLGLVETPRPSHVADALALALTGMSRVVGRIPNGYRRQLIGEPQRQARRADT